MTIVGFEKVRYTSKNTGKEVEGFRFHCTDDSERKNLVGMSTFSEFVSDQVGRELLRNFSTDDEVLGQIVEFRYNRFGRVSEIEIVS